MITTIEVPDDENAREVITLIRSKGYDVDEAAGGNYVVTGERKR